MLQDVQIDHLVKGMFVTRITDHVKPIKLASPGMIRSGDDIEQMRSNGVLAVEIDLSRSVHQTPDDVLFQPNEEDIADFQSQMQAAMEVYEQVKERHSIFLERIAAQKTIDVNLVGELSGQIVDAVFDSPDAMCVIAQLKQAEQYILDHSVNCVILTTVLAKKLKLSRDEIYQYGLGAMIMDIGMARLPLLLTHKFGELNDKEARQMRQHVEWAVELAEQSDCVTELGINLIRQHHERLDGSGYPGGLRGEQVSLGARLVAVVDTFDALTTNRPFRNGFNNSEAFRIMREEEKETLDQSLVSLFISHLGSYPTGSMVKLSNNLIGVVFRQIPDHPDRPMVMVIFDTEKKRDVSPYVINLMREPDVHIIDAMENKDGTAGLMRFIRG